MREMWYCKFVQAASFLFSWTRSSSTHLPKFNTPTSMTHPHPSFQLNAERLIPPSSWSLNICSYSKWSTTLDTFQYIILFFPQYDSKLLNLCPKEWGPNIFTSNMVLFGPVHLILKWWPDKRCQNINKSPRHNLFKMKLQ